MAGNMFGNIFPRAVPKIYSKTTTDNTVTTVATIALAEEDTCFVLAKAWTRNADGSKNGSFFISGLFYRNTSGNVTQEGATQDIAAEYTGGSTINLTFAADSTNQTIDVNVTGETSETFSWDVEVTEHMKINA